MLCKGFDGGFGGVVGGIPWRVRDALFGARNHYRCGMLLGAETGEEGRYAVYDAEEVGVHDLCGILLILKEGEEQFMNGVVYFVEVLNILPSTLEPNACIQHQEIHLPEIHLHFGS